MEPRDVIYALCGISADASGPDVLTPDYSMPAQEPTRKISEFLFRHDLTKMPGSGIVSTKDLAMRVEQLNSMAILVHLENRNEKLCTGLVNRVTETSTLKVVGACARLYGSARLISVTRKRGVVVPKPDSPRDIFRDAGLDVTEFLSIQRPRSILVTAGLLTAALQHCDWDVVFLLLEKTPFECFLPRSVGG
ncbi:uncharacterized protein LY79DRAFT_672175 [Colletotrichum navitas]|uniref:Uncharacterized protein n=1 Tax=Colletotrichum navitas TaxID=681940 RepID=A0AAD8V2R7_9PEZI|nr:uncharacterized protein LY79DRAFT_672175 [Colletotrichum navitas]KAK1579983.1 hypothetical protein LY79DRAFT_672175 [Colletotrichum navitas]